MLISYRKKATHQQTIRPLAPLLCLLFSLSYNGAGGAAEPPSPEPVKLIFDTDMDTDVDDIGAIAVVHALADAGEIEILATVVSSKLPDSALCLNAINTFYGRSELPVGAPMGKGASVRRGTRYADRIAEEFPHALTEHTVPDAVDVYRRVLAAAPDGSVVIATVGYLTNLRDLLKSGPDQHSPLSGSELVARKVKELSCMGGRYPADRGAGESGNFRPDPDSTKYVARRWPTPIMFGGDEIGEKVWTGERVRSELPENHPIRRAYDLFLGEEPERQSWDQVAVLYAARGLGQYWTAHHEGFNEIVKNGNNVWRPEPDLENHSYLIEKMDPERLADVFEDLMVRAGRR
jgi:inosine-uridine nucleoside N-ribohydrolase